ncbi:hypothetical protein MH117_09640 [Paenibacillus sp. ACRRX]|uniref:hypothetical protein n=1 Tax=Paenibacillus sp. ACRRX TaxID=2918206 RepID=UPI001EF5F1E0|nr:hypothetical protein [Paenibacillus sp. ACRRX]MCG7407685.1 hypothetical protein [Paenibacillus sp. ACRRX]
MFVPRRLYFDKVTGSVFFESGNFTDMWLTEVPSVDLDIERYKPLSERNRITFDVIELEPDQYAQDFAECVGYRVNPVTKKLEFSYPDPNQPKPEPVYRKPLSEEVAQTKARVSDLELTIAEIMAQ